MTGLFFTLGLFAVAREGTEDGQRGQRHFIQLAGAHDASFRAVESSLLVFPDLDVLNDALLDERGSTKFGNEPRPAALVVAHALQQDDVFGFGRIHAWKKSAVAGIRRGAAVGGCISLVMVPGFLIDSFSSANPGTNCPSTIFCWPNQTGLAGEPMQVELFFTLKF